MPKVICIYKLKPGATMADYKKFSREIDQVITPKQKVVRKFAPHEVTEHYQGGKGPLNENPPFDVFEVIDVEDFGEWVKTVESEGFKKVMDAWNMVGDGSTYIMLSGERIKKKSKKNKKNKK